MVVLKNIMTTHLNSIGWGKLNDHHCTMTKTKSSKRPFRSTSFYRLFLEFLFGLPQPLFIGLLLVLMWSSLHAKAFTDLSQNMVNLRQNVIIFSLIDATLTFSLIFPLIPHKATMFSFQQHLAYALFGTL